MAEDDCEIEYLEEDEEIVQQYVQNVPVVETEPVASKKKTSQKKSVIKKEDFTESETSEFESSGNELLVERKSTEQKRKNDSDSDYDPHDDLHPPKKKKRPATKRTTTKNITNVQPVKASPNLRDRNVFESSSAKTENDPPTKNPPKTLVEKFHERKSMDIRIPDFEDPLCLPARAIRKENYDLNLLKRWNNLCLEHIKVSDGILKPDNGSAVSSSRTIVFKNSNNVTSGKVETSIWGKVYVTSEDKMRKSEVFQGTLPRYKDLNIKKPYKLLKGPIKKFHHVNEVIITKETYKDEEMLVVYRPSDAISAVYKKVEDADKLLSSSECEEGEPNLMKLKEVACCKVCAPCYHASWRGTKLRSQDTQNELNMRCPVCGCRFVSMYNLLSHVKLHHTSHQIRLHKTKFSQMLAQTLDYHYKCRVCQEQFLAIKDLRKHVASHKGSRLFRCEVCNHITY